MLLAQAEVQPTVPDTVTWTFTGTAIIVGISLLFLLIIPRTIRFPHTGPKMPLPFRRCSIIPALVLSLLQ
jgi:photosystem I subunit 10